MSDANSLSMAAPPATSSSRPLKPANTKPSPVSDRESSPSESESEASQPAKPWQGREAPSPAESMPSSVMTLNKGADGAASDTPVIPTQKRRRVTRACDECRRKKIKCDGKQPCTHCQVYSYECTYDKPSNRRRNPAPQYIEALEDRLHKAETLLRKFMPDLDLADPNLDPAVQQEFRNRERARTLVTGTRKGDPKEIANPDAQILSMIETIGQIDLDEKGAWDFHGISSGAVFLRKIQEHFPPGLLTPKQFSKPFLQKLQRPPGVCNLDSPGSSTNSSWSTSMSAAYVLPPRETVDHLCYLALHCATCLIRIVHVPSFNAMIDRLYEIPPETYDERDTRSLGLLYAVMALGCMYDVPQDLEPLDTTSYKSAMEQGVKYYTTARLIFKDITDCVDLTTLQAILFMTLFLQSTSNLAGCYSILGIAFRSAIRMGMHRHVTHPQMNKIEDEVRRRLWFIIRQMDTYVSAILGFPMMAVDDVDQRFPTEVDDQYITDTEIQSVQLGTPSFFQAFNAHTKLMDILAKIVKYVYPLKGVEECVIKAGRLNATYMISYKSILDIEAELQNWLENLPDAWKPSNEGDPEVVRVRHLLRFAYAHVQMMLYRPFTHYSSPRLSQGKSVDQRAFHCAASAISVSRNIVHIWTEIRKQGVLIGPYWFILYTELFAILSLVFFVLENPDKPGSDEILADATAGRDMIAKVSRTSQAAEKVTMLLNPLFEKLPEKLNKAKGRPIPSKKRTAPTQKHTPSKHPQPSQSAAQTPQRKASGELARANGRRTPSKATQKIPHRPSLDSIHSSNHALSSNIQDIVFDNMSSGPDSATVTPPGAVYQQPQNFVSPSQHGGGNNSSSGIYNDMFSSNDPFAYPSQPLIELANQQSRHHSVNHGPQRQGSGMFNVPNMFDDIEGQLVHIPAYLMEAQNGQPQVDLTAQMYESTGMLTLEQTQAHAQQQHHHLRQQHQQHQPHHQAHHPQRQGSMDGMYHGGGTMNASWNPNFFQSSNFRG